MKLPVTWINESFKKDYSADDLSDLLTLSGIESEIEKDKGEEILDISLTPNRADCFSYKGIIQEISALDNAKIKFEDLLNPEIHHNLTMKVEVQSKEDCPVFMTRVIKSINKMQIHQNGSKKDSINLDISQSMQLLILLIM